MKGRIYNVRKKIFIVLLLSFVLVACSDNQEKIIEEVEKNHENIEVVHVYGSEEVDGNVTVINDSLYFKEGKIKSELPDITTFKNQDTYFVHTTMDYLPLPPDKLGTMRASLDRREKLYQSPFLFFKGYDDSFTENLVMGENDDVYTFRYDPEDDKRKEFYEKFILEFLFDAQNENQDNDDLDQLEIDLDSFELTFEIDSELKLITEMVTHEKATLALEGTSLTIDRKTTYEFDDYDHPETIEVPDDAFEITTIDTYLNDFDM